MNSAETEKRGKKVNEGMSDKKITAVLSGITFLIMAVMGCMLNVACVLDETGVVANAAYVAGHNWHDWVIATGGYFYKYGSALLYIPILKFFNNPFVIYKLIMVVNSLLIAMIPACAYRILRVHLSVNDKGLCAIVSFVVAIVPASMLYSLNAKADVALITWTWVLLVSILECMSAKEKQKQYIFSVLTGVVSVYLYMCHTRGVVFVIAAFMTVFAVRFILKNKSVIFWVYIVAVAVCMGLDKMLTAFFKYNIWGTGKLKNTLKGFWFGKYRKIFTFTGVETLVKNAAGWFFDSLIGTYGLVIAGIFFTLFIIVLYFKKKENISQKEFVLCLYGALVFMGTMALGMLFFFNANFKLMAGKSSSRVDRMFYSRYMSPTYAVLILVALYYLFIKKDLFGFRSKLFLVLFSVAVTIFVGTWIYDLTDSCGFSFRNVLDCGLFYRPDYFGKDAGDYKGPGLANALMAAAVLGLILLIIFLLLSRKEERRIKLAVSLVGLGFLVNLSCNYINLRFNADMRTMNICGPVFAEMEKIMDQYNSVAEEYHDLYYDPKKSSGYKFYQMGFPNFNVLVKKKAVLTEADNAFIVARNHVADERWMGEDCYLLKDYDYEHNINAIIVKGNDLKQSLEEHGIQVIDMPADYGQKQKNSVSADYWEAVAKSWQSQRESLFNETKTGE